MFERACLSGTTEGEGLVGLRPYQFFACVNSLRAPRINMTVCKCMINAE